MTLPDVYAAAGQVPVTTFPFYCSRETSKSSIPLSGAGYSTDHRAPGAGYSPERRAPGAGYSPEHHAPGAGYSPEHRAPSAGFWPEHRAPGAGYSPERLAPGAGFWPEYRGPGAGSSTDHSAPGVGYSPERRAPGAGYPPEQDNMSDHGSSPSRLSSPPSHCSSPSQWSAAEQEPLHPGACSRATSCQSTTASVRSGYRALGCGDQDWGLAEQGAGAAAAALSAKRGPLCRGLAAAGVACLASAALACAVLARGAGGGSTGSGRSSSSLLRTARSTLSSPRRLVGEIYTFGAPGSSTSGLYDASREDGCIAGLRVYSHTERAGIAFRRPVADPVSWITAQFNFSHPKMEALEASDQNVRDNPIHPCNAERSDPQSDDFWWMSGHLIYETVLKAHADFLGGTGRRQELRKLSAGSPQLQDRIRKAHLMIHFSFMVYTPHVSKLVVDAPDWGWTLVGHATSESSRTRKSFFSTPHKDHVTLYQHPEDLRCILAFEGTNRNDQSDILSDLDISTQEFCGLGPVHDGFRDKLVQTLRSKDYVQIIKPKLSSCSDLTLAGHSLGGAQAELFAACANFGLQPGDVGFEDHQLVAYARGSPSRLPSFDGEQVPSSFLRNKGTGLCLDVTGTMNTHSGAEIGLWECEFPSGNYSKDQRWRLTPDGFLVSSLSGKCADVSGANPSLGGSELRQWPCEFHIGESSVQRWEHTSEGFLKHVVTGRCLDSKLATYPCPHTDQLWQVQSDGHIVNRMTGLCADARGLPGAEDDTSVTLWECEYSEDTNQRWDLLPSGVLRNRRSQKCLNWESGQKMSLTLASCDSSPVLSVELSDDGFMRSKETGLCVNVEGEPGTKPGAAVTLSACEDKHIETSGLWTLMPGGFVRNVGNDWENQHKCLALYGRPETDDKVVDGAPIHVDLCEIGTDQRWELTEEGYIRSSIGGRKCVDLDSHSGKLRLEHCVEWSGPSDFLDMKWQATPAGELQNKESQRCITALDASEGGGVGLRPCSGGSDGAQQWDLRPSGALSHQRSGRCLALQGGAGEDQPSLELGSCGAAGALPEGQRWQLTAEGFLQSSSSSGRGACLFQRQGAGGQGGLAAQACPATVQLWELLDSGLLRNRLTGQCATAELHPAGMPSLSASSCSSGGELQQWERVSA